MHFCFLFSVPQKVTKKDKKKTKPLTSTEPLDDYRRLDSNSSNVSSRVGTDKEVSGNH